MITEAAITSSGIIADLGEFFSGFEGIKNFILSLSGVTIITLVYKVRGLLNLIKKPDFESKMFQLGEKFVSDLTQKPELTKEVFDLMTNLPAVQKLISDMQVTKEQMILELEGRLFDVEAKIKSGMFTDEQLAHLVEYKAKLIDYVENAK